ncbi:hypothetical protein A3C96_02320 [Candidatus Uhrbacteria bacterium RIFCSPHIGHO2_02_FULL_60_10]|uniref:Uncharacterized protein n=1 Tax=Candidatus Uhrbacteria bacterium RIFCSPHIGHO2_02_FULL_60_10 TaxID=1802392 RepID=A0A1F7U6Z1_9BACT|nr:MAG: hypothetical protein A3C96_02320 [Candidatus Uhrbacteria bacterium RIFCSPHIGHO2_02_FULL_60_10]
MRQLISPGDLIVQSVRQYPSQARAYGEIAIWYVLLAMSGWAFEKIVSAITIDKGLRLLANLLFALPSGLIAFALFLAVE